MKNLNPLIYVLALSLIITIGLGSGLLGAAQGYVVAPVYADTKTDACKGLDEIDNTQGCYSKNPGGGVTTLASSVLTIITIALGAVALIMIVVSGYRFMTSGGDSTKVAAARSALIYALIGIAVAALAQFLVHFVLNQANQT